MTFQSSSPSTLVQISGTDLRISPKRFLKPWKTLLSIAGVAMTDEQIHCTIVQLDIAQASNGLLIERHAAQRKPGASLLRELDAGIITCMQRLYFSC